MTEKKELSLEELDGITGGVWTEDAKCYLLLNWDKIYAKLGKNKEIFKGFLNAVASAEESKQVYDVKEAKTFLAYMCIDISNFIDYDPNNPEHVKKVQY